MPLTWPTNTAQPPPGWDALVEWDGTRPMGWFTTTTTAGMRVVARGYPTWDDAPFDVDAEDRVPPTADELDHDEAEIHLHKIFDIAYRGYAFPDLGNVVGAATGPASHSYTNLDFVGGWGSAIGRGRQEQAALLERTLAGAKPASDVIVTAADRHDWVAAAHDNGLEAVAYTAYGLKRLWVAPRRLADRVDREALTAAWHALAHADPDTRRAKRILAAADRGLATAFELDLTQPPHGQPNTWWIETPEEGFVLLGAVLGYAPPTTYAVLSEPNDEIVTSLPTR